MKTVSLNFIVNWKHGIYFDVYNLKTIGPKTVWTGSSKEENSCVFLGLEAQRLIYSRLVI